jgi:hypothetical protein
VHRIVHSDVPRIVTVHTVHFIGKEQAKIEQPLLVSWEPGKAQLNNRILSWSSIGGLLNCKASVVDVDPT